MEKIKSIFNKIFSVDFLLKILIIVTIMTIIDGRFKLDIRHYVNLSVSSSSGGIEVKIIK